MSHEAELTQAKKFLHQECNKLYREMYAYHLSTHPESKLRQFHLINVTFSSRLKRAVARCFYHRGEVRFSLTHLTPNVTNQDYLQKLVVHETAHFFYPNHGPEFKKLCAAFGNQHEGTTVACYAEDGIEVKRAQKVGYFKCPNCGKVMATYIHPDAKRLRKKKCSDCGQRHLTYTPYE